MERTMSTSRRGYSVRGILTIVLAVFLTALLWTIFDSSAAKADEPSADWKGQTIQFDGHQYFAGGESEGTESHGLAQGTFFYVHVEELSERPLVRKAHVIYFAPGNSPPVATSAQYVVYDFSSSKEYSNPQGSKAIEITPQGESDQYASSCSVEGIGWIICPVTVFLANAMDWIFSVVAGFVAVQPATVNDPNSDLYVAWNVMRSIANIAFIIAFLIIIYSQLTSVGISNYGLKKLLPRLIVGALLVNLSFIICAIAVDISNILGYSLQDILIQIRQDTFNIDNDTWSTETTNWANLTGVVLSGGAATAGIIGLSVATIGDVGAAIYGLVPLLIGLLLAIMFVLIILAARQAIIIILIVIAPLAFVAYLLPNTEKWFEKWRDLFMTMLIFFPAFSLVFGGSQLASAIIIENANSIIMMIFGLAVQVAPLVITPLLLQLSGNLLGKIAGLVNDPRKGLLDRSKNWANDRAEMRRIQSRKNTGPLAQLNPFRRIGRRMSDGNRRVKDRTELYTSQDDTRYRGTRRYEKLFEAQHDAETDKKILDAKLDGNLKTKIRETPAKLTHEMKLRTLTEEATYAEKRLESIYEGLGSGLDLSRTQSLSAYTDRVSKLKVRLAATAISTQTSQRMQQNQLSKTLQDNTFTIDGVTLREWSGASDPDNGAASALTYAVNLQREAEAKLVNERTQLMKHFKLSGSQRQALTRGTNVTAVRDDGTRYLFEASDEFTRDAAYEQQLKTGSYDEVIEMASTSGTNGYDFRSTISDAIPANGLANKAFFLGGRNIDRIGQGKVAGIQYENKVGDKITLVELAAEQILEGKIKAEDIANNDPGALEIYLTAAKEAVIKGYVEPGRASEYYTAVQKFKNTAAQIISPDTDLDRHSSQATKDVLEKITREL